MPVYNLDKLMDETRRIAAEYRRSTGSTLPVSAELAKFDAIRLLGLSPASETERAVDACLHTDGGTQKVQIKGRVIFDDKQGQRVGQMSLDAGWDLLVLVLMDEDYLPLKIYQLSRDQLNSSIPDRGSLQKKTRGAMSVKKFKAISSLVWPADDQR
jgi:hypothetical protein